MVYFNKYMEFSPTWGLSLSFWYGRERSWLNIQPIFGSFFIKLPIYNKNASYGLEMDSPKIGFHWPFFDGFRSIFVYAWKRTVLLRLPWAWEHVRHSVLTDSQFLTANVQYEPVSKHPGFWRTMKKDEWQKPACTFKRQAPYAYKLKNGTIQNRTATVGIEEREWRWKWFTWLPWPRKISRSIDVEFSDEVGERSGSWKGGCLGCGYDMHKGETWIDTLRRMEREREFN